MDSGSMLNAIAPAFLALPEELLTSIVDAYIQSVTETGLRHLKDLRLVHSRLSHLNRLKCQLFHKVYLRADPRRLQALDVIESIAPYTRHVVFEPVTLRRSNCQALNFSVMKGRQRFEQAVFELIRNGASTKLAAVIRAMPKLRSVTITQAKLSSDKDVLVPTGDALLQLAVQSMILAGLSVENLFIEHHPDADFEWARRLSNWRSMAVNKLKSFHFHPSSDTREEIMWQYHPNPFGQPPPPLVTGLEPDRTLADLLKGCSSLEELSCCCPALVLGRSWEVARQPSLPALRRLEVADCLLDGPRFSIWLLSCSHLGCLVLTRLRPREGDQLLHWRPIFDSIRNHQNSIAITLDNVDIWAGLRWRVCLQHKPSELSEQLAACFPRRLCSHLIDYISGRGEWFSVDEQEANIGWT